MAAEIAMVASAARRFVVIAVNVVDGVVRETRGHGRGRVGLRIQARVGEARLRVTAQTQQRQDNDDPFHTVTVTQRTPAGKASCGTELRRRAHFRVYLKPPHCKKPLGCGSAPQQAVISATINNALIPRGPLSRPYA